MKVIPKVSPLNATVTAPPSKSYSARALLLAAASEGTTRVTNCLDADDTRYAVETLKAIGFEVSGTFKEGITIGPRRSMSANEVPLYVGNAGTAMRFLTGWLAFTPGRFLLRGEHRMHQRPIGDLVDVLLSIGGEVEYVESEGYPPLRIRGKKMRGGFDVTISAETSSQFASSLMMAGAGLPDGITIRLPPVASAPYLDSTADILKAFGAEVTKNGNVFHVSGGRLQRDEYRVEGDYSSASYWFAAAAATGGVVRVQGLAHPSAQGDSRFLDILESMRCTVDYADGDVTVAGPGSQVPGGGSPGPDTRYPIPDTQSPVPGTQYPLQGGTFDCNATPDLVPTLAAIAPLASGPVEIINVANLRVKESDRLATVTSELRKLGVTVDERPDSLRIEPGWSSEPATIDTHNDHRIAMAFAIAGLARGNVTIAEEGVVSNGYPRFWMTLDEVVGSALA